MSNNNLTRQLKLHSPAGVEPAVFTWPSADSQKTKKEVVFIGGDEIVRTIRLVFEDYPALYQRNLGLDNCDVHSYPKMKELCEKFNKIIDAHLKLNRGTEAFSARLEQRATAKLFRHILAQVYSRAVTDPDKLRDYQPFSPSVYGETSPDLIDSILRTIHLTEDQTFIDLGSGVGNVVLHVAALADCKHVYGIEHEEIPANYARAMAEEFRSWMRWYGKHYSEFQLEQGDFLTHPTVDERIKEADVIFANNYVFGSTVNHELKVKFMNMKDGAQIVSSREFCSESFRLNDRTRNDLGAVMHISKPDEFFGKVSWSDKCVQYYLHVIDHSKLAHYYEKTHQLHMKASKINHSKQHHDDDHSKQHHDDDHSKQHHDDDHSSSSHNSSTSPSLIHRKSRVIKLDENHPPTSHPKRKRKTHSPSTSSSNPSTMISARGRKIQIKHQSDQDSDFDSDLSNEDLSNSKRPRSSYKDFHTTLNDLHHASENFIQSNQKIQIKNERFNYQNMTKLSDENLQLNHLSNGVFEHEDQRFLNSINSYLEQFRQRLLAYFNYMKSDVYREHLRKQLDNEMELNKVLKAKVHCLESNIKSLLEDAISLLKVRTNELGIEDLHRPIQLISYASNISTKHKELSSKVASLEKEIADYDQENEEMNVILSNIQTNGKEKSVTNENIYSTLLMNMSKQQLIQSPTYLPISPNSTTEKHFDFSQKYNIVKSERKTDFIIQKRAKKNFDSNPNRPAIVSPIKIIKVTDRYSPPSVITPNSVDNLLSSKQLEPVQVHSLITKAGQQIKSENFLPQSLDVKTLINRSPSSKISDQIKKDMSLQSPRKKRDFYGKSSTSDRRVSCQMNSTDTSLSNKIRPSSTPACTEVLPLVHLPDRPVSIPPLKTSS